MIVCTLSFVDKLHEVSSSVKAVIYTRVYAFVYGYFQGRIRVTAVVWLNSFSSSLHCEQHMNCVCGFLESVMLTAENFGLRFQQFALFKTTFTTSLTSVSVHCCVKIVTVKERNQTIFGLYSLGPRRWLFHRQLSAV